MTRNRHWARAFVLLGLGIAIALAWQCHCGTEVPYNSNSPAAKIRDQGLTVPVEGADEYVKQNLSFSPIMVDYYERGGRKSMKCYCKASRLTDVDRDDQEYDYTLELRFGLEKDGKVYRTLTRSGDFTTSVILNDLCTEDSTVIPDRIVVARIRVTRRRRPKTETVPPETRPASRAEPGEA